MLVSKTAPSIRRLFASQDNHDNKSLNTEVQKQNENYKKKLQTKVVDLMIFERLMDNIHDLWTTTLTVEKKSIEEII